MNNVNLFADVLFNSFSMYWKDMKIELTDLTLIYTGIDQLHGIIWEIWNEGNKRSSEGGGGGGGGIIVLVPWI